MNEELHWQPMASRDLDREQPPHLRISSAGRRPPGPQTQNRMALGVKGGGCWASGTPCLRPRLWGQCQKPV